MPVVRKRRIWWEHVPEAVSYVVFASKDPALFDPAHFSWEATLGVVCKSVVGKNEIVIPDEWPEFPTEPGTYQIAITAKDDMGNQSDPFLSSAQFKFRAPASPSKAGVESL